MIDDSDRHHEILALAESVAPDLLISGANRFAVYGPLILLAWYASLWPSYWWLGEEYFTKPMTYLIGIVFVSPVLPLAETIHRWRLRRRREALVDRAKNGQLQDVVIERLSSALVRRREDALGANSSWSRTRDQLVEAKQEADRGLRYWEERARQDPENETVMAQLEVASALSAKFSQAVRELDRRSEALLAFVDRCEAKLSALAFRKRDLAESRRLVELSARADDLVSNASVVLETLGAEFVSAARGIAEALGTVERLYLIDLAGDVPLDRLDVVADRILASRSNGDRLMLGLAAALDEVSGEVAPHDASIGRRQSR